MSDKGNIFDEASKAGDKKKKKTEPAALRHPPTDKEVKQYLERMQKMGDELQKKMEKVIELSGMNQSEAIEYIENPKNFPLSAWSRAQNEKKQLEEKISEVVGGKIIKHKEFKKKKKISKERKGKTLGSRKGWIQM